MIISVYGEMIQISDSIVAKWPIKSETLIYNVYFIETAELQFSCLKDVWENFKIEKRDFNINEIID